MSEPNRKSLLGRRARRALMALLSGAPTLLSAQGASSARTEGPLVLRLPVSARVLAMGNAGLASTDADVLLINPGMLSSARGMASSIQRYGQFGTAGALASVTTAGVMTVGVGVQFLDWQGSRARYADAVREGATTLSDGGPVDASSSAFTLGVARAVKGWRIGGSVKYADERFGADHDGTVAFDLGVMKPMGPGTLGLVAQNLGAGPRLGGVRAALPTRVGLGYGGGPLPLSEHVDLSAQMALTVEGDGFVRPAGGVELAYVPIEGVQIVLRNGLRLPREGDEPLVTGGLGLTVDRFSFDYAVEPTRGGRPVSHRVGLRIK